MWSHTVTQSPKYSVDPYYDGKKNQCKRSLNEIKQSEQKGEKSGSRTPGLRRNLRRTLAKNLLEFPQNFVAKKCCFSDCKFRNGVRNSVVVLCSQHSKILTNTCRSLDHSRAKSHACEQQPLRSKRQRIVPSASVTNFTRNCWFPERRRFTLAPSTADQLSSTGATAEFRPPADFRPAELKEQSLVHGLCWDKTCCSKIFEGRNRDRGAVIARSNTNTKSSCWIRTMLRVDGTWVIEPCADYWKPIPREVTSSMVFIPSRISYVDTLPPMSEFFKLLKKRWGDVCIEVAKFFASGKLLPVGSVNFCRTLAIFEPVSSFVSRQPTVFYLRLSQFCTVFVQYSLFSGLSAADLSSFVLTIAMDRTVLRNVQIAQNSVSVALIVQLIDECPSSASTSEDSSMHFDVTDTVATLPFLPTVSTEVQDVLAQTYRVLFNNVRHDMQDHKNLLSLDLKTYQQKVSNQVGAAALYVVDVRRVVKVLDAKVAAVAIGLDDVRKDLSELVAYINRGGNDKKREDSSSRGPQPPPDDQGRPGEGSASRGSGSDGDGRRRGDSGRSSKRRCSGESPPRNIRYGPYPPNGIQKKSAPWWLYGEKEL
ncbi:hypothetical protein F511_11294 [Dorcoceras hygrometricum]|uniref:Uncharacterized protein n=1 Tax=Dorcoceras hygrometricum TaxID=472368 RepID=A0A2Z7CIC6_9LAMI|nr:hypothetical protein F511_11294 [Dorcoceras hygrometricum]